MVKLTGKIVYGSSLANRIGLPTAIVQLDDQNRVPAYGVYSATLHLDKIPYKGMVYMGKQYHTDKDILVEATFFDDDIDLRIYGDRVEITLVEFLRPDKEFYSKRELISQIDDDKVDAIISLINFSKTRP